MNLRFSVSNNDLIAVWKHLLVHGGIRCLDLSYLPLIKAAVERNRNATVTDLYYEQ